MKSVADSNIILCSIVRNAEKGLHRNLPVISCILNSFNDYRAYIYENDSVDETKNILEKWYQQDSLRRTISINNTDSARTIPLEIRGGVNPFFSHKRIDKMAHLRNYYMSWLADIDFDADYVMIVDFDVACIDAESILSSFERNAPEWDAVTAFGYSTSPHLRRRYHDTYALTLWEDRNIIQTEQQIKDNATKVVKLLSKEKWLRVASAFGGLAIYKANAVRGLYYMEPVIDNKDSRVEVRCEHYSLYLQMMDRGYDRFYINPLMTLKYQDLSLRIIWNSLKRKLYR